MTLLGVGRPLVADEGANPSTRRRRWGRILLVGLGVLGGVPLLAVGVLLLVVPAPVTGFAPESWDPDDVVAFDPAITEYAAVEPLGPSVPGPEDVVVDEAGRAYTGDRNGIIWRIAVGGGAPERWADTGGRPLGLAFAADGRLIVANHGLGLQAVSPDGSVATLVDEVAGAPVLFANDLDVGADGTVYFSDSSRRYNTTTLGPDSSSYLLPDAIDGRASGRLLSHDLTSGRSEVLLEDLYFPNGVALTADGSALWVAESNRYRVVEYDLTSRGTSVVLANLPGTPDNLDRDAGGRMLVASYQRNRALDGIVLPSDLARRILIRLPTDLFVNEEDPLSGGIVVVDQDGTVDAYVTGLTPAATSVHPVGDRWYLGALLGQPVRWMDAVSPR